MNDIIKYLLTPYAEIYSVNKKTETALFKLVKGNLVRDFLSHIPTGIIDRTFSPDSLFDLEKGQIITFVATVIKHSPSISKRMPYKVELSYKGENLFVSFFNSNKAFLRNILPLEAEVAISGKCDYYKNMVNIIHPDYIVPAKKLDDIKRLEGIYPLTLGVSQKAIQKIIQNIVGKITELPEWLSDSLRKDLNFKSWNESMQHMHNPQKILDIGEYSIFRKRLAYDELFAYQLALNFVRNKSKLDTGQSITGDCVLRKKIVSNLGFSLTEAQTKVLKDIYQDQISNNKMYRLLQGDVGSGKTIVAILAMLNAVECGKQAVLMAPTSVLANQHYIYIKKLLSELNVSIILLTGRDKNKKREEKLKQIVQNEIQIIIGTHALFQETVEFSCLSMIVVDEQHRFGVNQRNALANKGKSADILLMSATPIPRTLSQTIYGDMDVSRITDKPHGRKPIKTTIVSQNKVPDLIEAMQRAIKNNEKIYWICPLVEESEKMDVKAVEERFEEFKQVFGEDKVGMVHGKLKEDKKNKEIDKFAEGHYAILIATTVIEVGINVPDATIIIIEHAEQFGLSQLHQLRGRVGRGLKDSYCILVYSSKRAGENSQKRLKILRETEDGFLIAEHDLKIRGAGDVLGTKQSGLPDFKFARLDWDLELLKIAAKDSKLLLHNDPKLESQRGKNVKYLLELLEYDHYLSEL